MTLLHRPRHLYFLLLSTLILDKTSSKDLRPSKCHICEVLITGIDEAMKETENGTYEGGMSVEHTRKLGDYKRSEVRLIKVMEKACDLAIEKKSCLDFLGNFEDEIEDWFRKSPNMDLYKYLCVDTANACCPASHFGKKCQKCLGFQDEILCSGHGRCDGDGEREGSGKCVCDHGYKGEFCEECAENSFRSSSGRCIPCHVSCKGPCANETAEGCLGECSDGWVFNDRGVCVDIDECELKTHGCKFNQFCVNRPGSHLCKDCHPTCLVCKGESDTECEICQIGLYKNEENKCVDTDECAKNEHNCEGFTYCVNTYGSHECEKCHTGCLEGCSGPALKDCFKCQPGYEESTNGTGCVDVNECERTSDLCPPGKYCLNESGGYKCESCDEMCESCFGPGPHSCNTCATGYINVDGYCQDINSIKEKEEKKEDL